MLAKVSSKTDARGPGASLEVCLGVPQNKGFCRVFEDYIVVRVYLGSPCFGNLLHGTLLLQDVWGLGLGVWGLGFRL